MNWLPWPLIPKRQWSIVRHKEKRSITWEEHRRIVDREGNAERKALYQLALHLGASQGDLANLHAEDVDWASHTITYVRMKTKWRETQTPPQIKFGHNSKAVHRAYARNARVTLPSLEDYEKTGTAAPVIPLPLSTTA